VVSPVGAGRGGPLNKTRSWRLWEWRSTLFSLEAEDTLGGITKIVGLTIGIYTIIKYKNIKYKIMEIEIISLIIVSIVGSVGSLISILHLKKCHSACMDSECFKGNTPATTPLNASYDVLTTRLPSSLSHPPK